MPNDQTLKLDNGLLEVSFQCNGLERIQIINRSAMENRWPLRKIWEEHREFLCQWIDESAQFILSVDVRVRGSCKEAPTENSSMLDAFLTIVAIRQLSEQLLEHKKTMYCLTDHINSEDSYLCESHDYLKYLEEQLSSKRIDLKMGWYLYPPHGSARNRSCTGLHLAALTELSDEPDIRAIVRRLCKQPNIILEVDAQGKSALELAIEQENKIVQEELARALVFHVGMQNRGTPVALGALIALNNQKGDSEFVIKQLLKIPDIYNKPVNSQQQTALHIAIMKGRSDLVELMLACPDINIFHKDTNGKAPHDLIASPNDGEWIAIRHYINLINCVLFFWGSRSEITEKARQEEETRLPMARQPNESRDINTLSPEGYIVLHFAATVRLSGIDKITAALCSHPNINLLAIGCNKTPLDLAILYKNERVQAELVRALCRAIGTRCDGFVFENVEQTLLHAIRQDQDMESCKPFVCELLKVLYPDAPDNKAHWRVTSQSRWDEVKKSALCLLVGKACGKMPRTVEHAWRLAIRANRMDLVEVILTKTDVNQDRYRLFTHHRASTLGSTAATVSAAAASGTDTLIRPASLCP